MRTRLSRLIFTSLLIGLAGARPDTIHAASADSTVKASPPTSAEIRKASVAKPSASPQRKTTPLKKAPRKAASPPQRPMRVAQAGDRNNAQPANYGNRTDVSAFIMDMVSQHGFKADELQDLFARTRQNATVLRLMTPATSSAPRSWSRYRARFVEPIRIEAGLRFWSEHSAELERAARQYGVPEHIIVGIIGVETVYGRNMGSFRVIDTLTTLSFDYPSREVRDRSPFFRSQLEEFLLLVRDQRLDVFEPLGSYAGAIGIPQFMPGSYRHLAVDFNGDGVIDLRNSPADAIGSVAHYLKEHGWERGANVYTPVNLPQAIDAAELQSMVQAGAEPRYRADALRQAGFEFDARLEAQTLLALIDLPEQDQDAKRVDYVLGLRNFYALTRYNRSYYYAMAVAELGQAIRIEHARRLAAVQDSTSRAPKLQPD